MHLSGDQRGTCPRCGEPLREWIVGDVTLDGCDACGGCWFDAHELEAAASLAGDAVTAAEAEFAPGLATFAGGGPGRCPRCATKLVERSLKPSNLAVHGCPDCGGMWFDEGRLEGLAQTLPEDRERRPAAASAAELQAPSPQMVRCPHCGEPNGAGSPACASCGRSLEVPLDGMPGALLGHHGFDWATLRSEFQYAMLAMAVAFVLWDPPHHGYSYRRGHLGVSPNLGLLMTIAAAVLVVWYARWLFKTWSIDVSAGGLTVRRISGRRFIPWSAMRRLVLLDLPGRVRSSFFAPRQRPYVGHSDYARAVSHAFDGPPRQAWTQTPKAGDRIAADPLRGAVLLFTDYGLVTIGPHMMDSGGLYQVVRERWGD